MFLFFLSFALVATILPIVAGWAVRAGFVDAPGGRKQHQAPVPPVGGLVLVPIYLLVHAVYGLDWAVEWPLYVGVIALLVIGGLDDRWHLDAWIKFAVQIAVAFLVVIFGVCRIDSLGDLFGLGDFTLGFMAVPFSVAAVALLINAINLMDGLDGLAGGQSFTILAILALVCAVSGYGAGVIDLMPALGALAGFLLYNLRAPWRKRASVFLGDAGTLALGLILAWHAIGLAANTDVSLEPISVAWILALPIMDECAQFYRRVRAGHHPFSPDRGHFHHHFMDAGYDVKYATPLILLFSSALGVLGYGLAEIGVPLAILTSCWIVLILLHLYLTDKNGFYAGVLQKFRS